MSEYQRLQEQASGAAGEDWRAADREAQRLRDFYESMAESSKYSAEHKAETCWAEYEKAAEKVERYQKAAKERLIKEAESAERASVPLPKDASFTIRDANELLAVQHETMRLTNEISNLEVGPMAVNKRDFFRKKYGEALKGEGIEAAVSARAVLRAAEAAGVNRDEVLDPHRKDHHKEAKERAERANRMAFTIGGGAPKPPYPRPADTKPRSLQEVLHHGPRRYAPNPNRGRRIW